MTSALVLVLVVASGQVQPQTQAPADTVPPQESLESVSLQQAVALAVSRPAADAVRARSQSADHLARAERRSGWWPTIGAEAAVTGRYRDLELQTPLGAFPLGSGSYSSFGVQVVQPLVDLRVQRYGAGAALHEARAARLQAARVEEQLAAEAASAHLRLLSIQAAQRSTRALIASLESQLVQSEARVAAGSMLSSDLGKIQLAHDRAVQQQRELGNLHAVTSERLGQAIGRKGAVAAADPDSISLPEAPKANQALVLALENRSDLAGLRQRREALVLRSKAVGAEWLPRLSAQASWQWNDSGQYSVDSWSQGAIVLSWNPFASGTRAPKRAALLARTRGARAETERLKRAIKVDLASALADLDTAYGGLALGETAVVQAAETLRVEEARHRAGRATTNDLLEAEADLHEERTRRDVARLEILRAWSQLQLTMGTPPESWYRVPAIGR